MEVDLERLVTVLQIQELLVVLVEVALVVLHLEELETLHHILQHKELMVVLEELMVLLTIVVAVEVALVGAAQMEQIQHIHQILVPEDQVDQVFKLLSRAQHQEQLVWEH
jgi:hypothetical protein